MAIDLSLSGRVLTVTVNGESASIDLANIRGDDGVRGPQGPAGDTTSVTALATTVNAISDYVVEEGTSGIWTYRKWNSGKAECWGAYEHTAAIDTASNGVYYGENVPRQEYPFLFADTPAEMARGTNSNSGMGFWLGSGVGNSTYNSAIYPIFADDVRSSDTYRICYYVAGHWK